MRAGQYGFNTGLKNHTDLIRVWKNLPELIRFLKLSTGINTGLEKSTGINTDSNSNFVKKRAFFACIFKFSPLIKKNTPPYSLHVLLASLAIVCTRFQANLREIFFFDSVLSRHALKLFRINSGRFFQTRINSGRLFQTRIKSVLSRHAL